MSFHGLLKIGTVIARQVRSNAKRAATIRFTKDEFMIQYNILFATDFSIRDKAAFETASALAMKANSKLYVLHVAEKGSESSTTSRETAIHALSSYIPDDISVNFEHVLQFGDPCKSILRSVEEHDIDLLVLGTHGRDGMNRAFNGSVAEKIIRKSTIPVMTVRQGTSILSTHAKPRILVPIDFSVYGYAALEYATRLAISVGGEITIAHVDETDHTATEEFPHGQPDSTEKQKEIWTQLRAYSPSSSKVSFTHKLLKGDPGRELTDYANSKHYDFIVQGTHGRTGLRRALMGSVAEKIVRHSNCAVISFRPLAKSASA